MKTKILTTTEASRIGREMGVRGLCIYRDDYCRDLWHVVTPGRNEVHEPMTEEQWRAFLKASGWIERTARLDAGNGRKVTVPENDEQDLFDAIQEQLSPEAVAVIGSAIQDAKTNNPEVDRQVRWFADRLTAMLGGVAQQNRLMRELGL